jgi:hypothetical protein
VSGFNVRDDSVAAGGYVVREADAHAWIEAWLPARGWVEFDPTPSAQYAELHGKRRQGTLTAWLEGIRGVLAETLARLRSGDWRATGLWLRPGMTVLLGLAAVATLGYGLLRTRRRRRARVSDVAHTERLPPELAGLLSALDAAWADSGHRRPAWRGLRDHLEALPAGSLDATLNAACADAADAFYRARFGGRAASAAELADLRSRLDPKSRPA